MSHCGKPFQVTALLHSRSCFDSVIAFASFEGMAIFTKGSCLFLLHLPCFLPLAICLLVYTFVSKIRPKTIGRISMKSDGGSRNFLYLKLRDEVFLNIFTDFPGNKSC